MMQPCPRQADEATLSSQFAHQSHWREDGTCSYCGSISPDTLFAAIEQGCELGPTDKNYKVYIDLVEPNPDEVKVVGVANFDPGPDRIKAEGWVPADATLLQRNGFYTDGSKWMLLGKRGPVKHAKFYFQHLNVEERHLFIRLLNDRKIKIGYPGHFYQLPFFCVKVAPKV